LGFRFRQSFSPFPGLKFNISKSEISTSVGTRGAWFNFGRKGSRATFSLPGTGISYVTNFSKRKAAADDTPVADAVEWLVEDQLKAVDQPNSMWPGFLAIIACFIVGLLFVTWVFHR
jgi:hypothetical protein